MVIRFSVYMINLYSYYEKMKFSKLIIIIQDSYTTRLSRTQVPECDGIRGNEKGQSELCCHYLIDFNQSPDTKSSEFQLQMKLREMDGVVASQSFRGGTGAAPVVE